MYFILFLQTEQEIAAIIQDLLSGTGGVVKGIAGADELVTAAQAETNISRPFGCLLNGSGERAPCLLLSV